VGLALILGGLGIGGLAGCGRVAQAPENSQVALTPTESVSEVSATPAISVTAEPHTVVHLANVRELPLSTEDMAASGFDGPVIWSDDGRLIGVEMSNMTLASSQIQLLDAASGRRRAVINGYNIRWDETDPGYLIFTQHQYYGPPNYGSHEVTLKVRQSDILSTGSFNEETVPFEKVTDDETGVGGFVRPGDTVLAGDDIVISKYTPNRQAIIFTKKEEEYQPLYWLETGQEAETATLLTAREAVIDYFDIAPSGDKLAYKKVSGETDEFGNFLVTEDKVKLLVADITK
jgi:hypothetical protein